MNKEKEKIAIERLRAFEPKDEPYYLCYSVGVESVLGAIGVGIKREQC